MGDAFQRVPVKKFLWENLPVWILFWLAGVFLTAELARDPYLNRPEWFEQTPSDVVESTLTHWAPIPFVPYFQLIAMEWRGMGNFPSTCLPGGTETFNERERCRFFISRLGLGLMLILFPFFLLVGGQVVFYQWAQGIYRQVRFHLSSKDRLISGAVKTIEQRDFFARALCLIPVDVQTGEGEAVQRVYLKSETKDSVREDMSVSYVASESALGKLRYFGLIDKR